MTFVGNNQIALNPIWLAAFVAFGIYVLMSARMEWGLGVFMSMYAWNRNIMVGPIVHNWFLLAVIYGAAVVYLYNRKPKFDDLIPREHRWILVWMVLWWAWVLLLVQLFNPPKTYTIRLNLLAFLIPPLPILLIIGKDMKRLKGFAISFVITTLVGCWTTIAALDVPITYLLSDPSLDGLNIFHLKLYNYHLFAYNCALALIIAVALFMQSRNVLFGLPLLAAAGICAHFMLLAGSRQSIAGTVVALVLFSLWGLFNPRTPKPRLLMMLAVVSAVLVLVYQIAPNLIVRRNEDNLAEAFDLVGDRGQYWAMGLAAFAESPMWGSGFVYPYTHNMIIGSLAEQGLVGTIFVAGFFYFVARLTPVIVNGRGDPALDIWRMAFFCVIVFGLVHSMASGSPVSVRHIYWGGTLLWLHSEQLFPAPSRWAPPASFKVGRRLRVAPQAS